MAQQLAQINSLQHLTALSELFLQVNSFADFCRWVATYLPITTEQTGVKPQES